MNWIGSRIKSNEIVYGTWLAMGSAVSAEIAAASGFDWVLIDMEHGLGGYETLLEQLRAVSNGNTTPIVRVPAVAKDAIQKVLDYGAAGVMVPYVKEVQEAQKAVECTHYPPQGIRGMTSGSRAATYGLSFKDYHHQANDEIVTVIQIETPEAVQNVDAIAALDGVDVLFVGPSDLSLSLGCFKQLDHPDMIAAKQAVVAAAKKHGKAAGILVGNVAAAKQAAQDGFTFIAVDNDMKMITREMSALAQEFKK